MCLIILCSPSETDVGLLWVIFTGSKGNPHFPESAERVECGNKRKAGWFWHLRLSGFAGEPPKTYPNPLHNVYSDRHFIVLF